jgi:predicted lipid-binding transport protein (Tim44 family)
MLFRRSRRMRAATRAAAVAATDDPAFAPDVLVEAVIDCFFEIQDAWQAREPKRLARVLTEELVADDVGSQFLFEVAKAVPEVQLVGVVNRPGSADDQVVALVSYELVPSGDRHREYWTLRRQGGQWRIAAIEAGPEGRHHLAAPLVAEPAADDALHDQSVLEVAAADPPPPTTPWSDLVSAPQTDPEAVARDVALIDPRFSHTALESIVRIVADAWMQAALGVTAPLQDLAEPEALRALTRPRGGESRVIVRGLKLLAVHVVAVDLCDHPKVTVEAEFRGRRALRNRGHETLRLGSLRLPTKFRERWTFALRDDRTGWRLHAAAPIGWELRDR